MLKKKLKIEMARYQQVLLSRINSEKESESKEESDADEEDNKGIEERCEITAST